MTLSIVILNYNTKELTLSCLTSLKTVYRKELEGGEVEILVVDNASTDGSFESISRFSVDDKGIFLIKNVDNLGFGTGNNVGAKKAVGEYVMFLNSDTEVLDKNFLEMTNFFKKNENVGVMGPKILNFDGTLQPSAANFYGLWNLMLMLLGLEKRKSPSRIEKVDWITGAAMMVEKKVFVSLGMFDENIFMYMEDHELCYRFKKKGLDTYFFPEAEIKHKSVGSSNRAFAITNIYKNVLYFYRKHKSYPEYLIAKLFLLIKAIPAFILGKVFGKRYYVDTYGKAIKAII